MSESSLSRRSPEQVKALILDAAAECLVEGGFASGRLLSAIARKAGISRPTLYKYGGSVEIIKQALVDRELGAFVEALVPRLESVAWTTEYLTDLLVFIVGYARSHPLLNAALRDVPDLILPVFTLQAEDTIHRIAVLASPVVAAQVEQGRIPDVDVPLLTDLLYRIAVSMIVIQSPLDLDDPDTLRGYLTTAIKLVATLEP